MMNVEVTQLSVEDVLFNDRICPAWLRQGTHEGNLAGVHRWPSTARTKRLVRAFAQAWTTPATTTPTNATTTT
jgi:hypothetical protein